MMVLRTGRLGICFPQFQEIEGQSQHKSTGIPHWAGPQSALHPQKLGQDHQSRQQKQDLTGQRYQGGLHRLADGLEKDASAQLEAVQGDEEQEDFQALHRKLLVQCRLGAEDADDGLREQLEHRRAQGHHHGGTAHRQEIGFSGPVHLPCAVVVADDGLGAHGDADHNAGDDLVDLHGNAQGGHGDLCAIFGGGAVLHQHIVHHSNDDGGCQLQKETGHPQAAQFQAELETRNQAFPGEVDGLEAPQIDHRQNGGYNLAQHRCDGRTGHPHPKHKDKEGVQNGVQNGAAEGCHHGIDRTAIRPHHRVEPPC